jgi:hypothetical protein
MMGFEMWIGNLWRRILELGTSGSWASRSGILEEGLFGRSRILGFLAFGLTRKLIFEFGVWGFCSFFGFGLEIME